MEHHVRVVGVLYIAVGAISGLAAIFQLLFFGGAPVLAAFLSIYNVVASVWLWAALLLIVPSIITGLALIALRDWARGAGIVLAVFQMINLPLGTALGFYALWVLFSEQADMLFTRRFGQYIAGRR